MMTKGVPHARSARSNCHVPQVNGSSAALALEQERDARCRADFCESYLVFQVAREL